MWKAEQAPGKELRRAVIQEECEVLDLICLWIKAVIVPQAPETEQELAEYGKLKLLTLGKW